MGEMGRFLQNQKRPKRHSGSDGGRAHTRARSVAARFEVTLASVAAFASSCSPVRVDVSLRARHRSPPKPRDFRDARFQMREATVARGGSSLGATAPPPPTSRSLPRRFKPTIDPGAGLDFDRMPGALALADPEVRALREDARVARALARRRRERLVAAERTVAAQRDAMRKMSDTIEALESTARALFPRDGARSPLSSLRRARSLDARLVAAELHLADAERRADVIERSRDVGRRRHARELTAREEAIAEAEAETRALREALDARDREARVAAVRIRKLRAKLRPKPPVVHRLPTPTAPTAPTTNHLPNDTEDEPSSDDDVLDALEVTTADAATETAGLEERVADEPPVRIVVSVANPPPPTPPPVVEIHERVVLCLVVVDAPTETKRGEDPPLATTNEEVESPRRGERRGAGGRIVGGGGSHADTDERRSFMDPTVASRVRSWTFRRRRK